MRVILHAGFHKTGTTTVQKTLRANRAALKPHLRFLLPPRMTALCEAARAWSVGRRDIDMALVRYEAAALAETWRAEDRRPMLLASEDLAGHMPGRHGLTGYDAVPQLMQAIAEALEEAQPGARVECVFTTRAAGPWLVSCHSQHLSASRMTLDAAEYARKFRASAELDIFIDQTAQTLAPRPVRRIALEDWADHPLGPLAALLLLADLPPRLLNELAPLPPQKVSPDAARRAALLALNRSDLDEAALVAAKRALLRGTV